MKKDIVSEKETQVIKKPLSLKERNKAIRELSKETNKNITKKLFKKMIGA